MKFVHNEYPFQLDTSAVKIWRRRVVVVVGGGSKIHFNHFCILFYRVLV